MELKLTNFSNLTMTSRIYICKIIIKNSTFLISNISIILLNVPSTISSDTTGPSCKHCWLEVWVNRLTEQCWGSSYTRGPIRRQRIFGPPTCCCTEQVGEENPWAKMGKVNSSSRFAKEKSHLVLYGHRVIIDHNVANEHNRIIKALQAILN